MEFSDVIKTRYSVRNFLPDKIPEDVLHKILEAGRLAPSAQNRQPWRYIVINDKDKISELARNTGLIGLANFFVKDAPCVIIACADTKKNVRINDQDYYLVDTAISFQQMLLSAWDNGIGSCWMAAFSEKPLKKYLNLPASWRVVALSPLGYPAEDKSLYTKSRFRLCRQFKTPRYGGYSKVLSVGVQAVDKVQKRLISSTKDRRHASERGSPSEGWDWHPYIHNSLQYNVVRYRNTLWMPPPHPNCSKLSVEDPVRWHDDVSEIIAKKVCQHSEPRRGDIT